MPTNDSLHHRGELKNNSLIDRPSKADLANESRMTELLNQREYNHNQSLPPSPTTREQAKQITNYDTVPSLRGVPTMDGITPKVGFFESGFF